MVSFLQELKFYNTEFEPTKHLGLASSATSFRAHFQQLFHYVGN